MNEDLSLRQVARNYINGEFIIDILVLIPFGAMFTYISEWMKFVWILKAYRIKDIQYYLGKRFFDKLIAYYIEMR